MILTLEKETLRTLSGPELTLQTQLEPMLTPQMQELNGGSAVSEAVSNVVSGVLSFIGSAIVSALDSVPTDEVASAISGAGISLNASGALSATIPI